MPDILWVLPFLHASTDIGADCIECAVAGAIIYDDDLKLMIWERLTTQACQGGKCKIAPIVGAEYDAKARRYLHDVPMSFLQMITEPTADTTRARVLATAIPIIPHNTIHGRASAMCKIAAPSASHTCARLRSPLASWVKLTVATLPKAEAMRRMRNGVTAGR